MRFYKALIFILSGTLTTFLLFRVNDKKSDKGRGIDSPYPEAEHKWGSRTSLES